MKWFFFGTVLFWTGQDRFIAQVGRGSEQLLTFVLICVGVAVMTWQSFEIFKHESHDDE